MTHRLETRGTTSRAYESMSYLLEAEYRLIHELIREAYYKFMTQPYLTDIICTYIGHVISDNISVCRTPIQILTLYSSVKRMLDITNIYTDIQRIVIQYLPKICRLCSGIPVCYSISDLGVTCRLGESCGMSPFTCPLCMMITCLGCGSIHTYNKHRMHIRLNGECPCNGTLSYPYRYLLDVTTHTPITERELSNV